MTTVTSHSDTFYQYFYHPESDSYITCPTHEVEKFLNTADGGLCTEITLERYLENVKDPKELPKDIRGILKNAEWGKEPYPKDVLQGDLWFDPKNQFPHGIRIYTSRVTDVRSDGVYCTTHSKYYVQFKAGEERRK